MKCIGCHTNEAIKDPTLGILRCESCQRRTRALCKPGKPIEFTSESIKQQRKEYADDIEQPHRQGKLNKRWVEVYGKDTAKRQGYTDEEIKHAEYVFNDDMYYKRY